MQCEQQRVGCIKCIPSERDWYEMSGVWTENFVYSGRLDPRIESPVVFTGIREGRVDYIGDVDNRHVRPPTPIHNNFILVLTHLGITNNLLYPIKYRKEMWIDEERL